MKTQRLKVHILYAKKAKAIFQKQLREKKKHHCINTLMVLYFSYIHKFDCEIKQ